MDLLINLMVGVPSQCIHVVNHRVAHLKHNTILLVDYTSIKLQKKKLVIANILISLQLMVVGSPSASECVTGVSHQ